MELSPVEIRILGCLVEKAATTPDNYPLSTNALVNACNQSSNRDPVMSCDEKSVDQAMLDLRMAGLARTVTGGRANKHRHVLDEAWGLSPSQLTLLAVLFLRGPQTAGELRSRSERMHEFEDLDAVDVALGQLSDRSQPFVAKLDRVPGQKERRWIHLVNADSDAAVETVTTAPDDASGAVATSESPATAREPISDSRDQADAPVVPDLRQEIERLRADVDRLYLLLGETPEDHG